MTESKNTARSRKCKHESKQRAVDAAKGDIDVLDHRIDGFFEEHAYAKRSYLDLTGTERTYVIDLPPKPWEIEIKVGHILHDLKSALDYLAVAVVAAYGQSTDRTYFPVRKSPDGLEEALCSPPWSRLPLAVADTIREVKPYLGGNDLLWLLHDSNRDDKHRGEQFQIRPGIRVGSLRTLNCKPIRLGPATGQHLVYSKEQGGMIQKLDEKRPTYTADSQGNTFLVAVADDYGNSIDILTVPEGCVFESDIKPTVCISFPQLRHFERLYIISVLRDMAKAVETTLNLFDHKFLGS